MMISRTIQTTATSCSSLSRHHHHRRQHERVVGRTTIRGREVFCRSSVSNESKDDEEKAKTTIATTTKSSGGGLGKSEYRPVWENDIDAEFRRKERFEKERQQEEEKKSNSGLGFGRVNMMDDLSVDIGQQVREIEKKKKEEAKERAERGKRLNALDLATTDKGDSKYNLDGWNYAQTKAER